MSTQFEKLRQEILALQPALVDSAIRLAGDESEAHALVDQVVLEALATGESRGSGSGDTRVWLFGLLRSTFHSVSRRRLLRPERDHLAVQRQLDRDAALAEPAEA